MMVVCAIVVNTSASGEINVSVKINLSFPTIHKRYVYPVLLYTWGAFAVNGMVATTVIVTTTLSKTFIVMAACVILDMLSTIVYV